MEFFHYLLAIAVAATAFYLLFPFGSVLLAAAAPTRPAPQPLEGVDFGVIITAYKDALITLPLLDSLEKQLHAKFHVYLVADCCDLSGFSFSSNRFTLLAPEQPLNSKVASIQYAMARFKRPHAFTLIFDPDNLAHPACLKELSRYAGNGFNAVQGRRAAKNLDSMYACLDAVGEYYYNHTQRYAPFILGSSAPIAGSGMAIATGVYLDSLNALQHPEGGVILAEDKHLQHYLVERGIRIAYAKQAVIYDEKISSGYQAERQRTRWLASYFQQLHEIWRLFIGGVLKGDYNRAFFALVISSPPMVVLAGASALLAAITAATEFTLLLVLCGAGVIFVFTFLLVLTLDHAEPEIWKSLWGIPLFAFKQISALFRFSATKKDFLVTDKTKIVYIDDLLEREKRKR